MIPQQVLSSEIVPGTYVHGDVMPFDPLDDYEPGGVALNNPSQGLFPKLWRLRCVEGHQLRISAPGVSETVLLTRSGTVTELSLAFDQNMRPTVAFVEDGQAWLYWYNSLIGGFDFTELASDVENPRVTMDDKREMQIAANDVILAYKRGGNLYFRAQRDRYTVEYPLIPGPGLVVPSDPLRRVGMTNALRLQFEFGTLEPDA